MSQPICKHCGQPIGPSALRGGVYLSAQRRRVFDMIKKRPGLSALELAAFLYPDKPAAAGAKAVIQTVHHINDQLASTNVRIKKCGYRIEGDTGGEK